MGNVILIEKQKVVVETEKKVYSVFHINEWSIRNHWGKNSKGILQLDEIISFCGANSPRKYQKSYKKAVKTWLKQGSCSKVSLWHFDQSMSQRLHQQTWWGKKTFVSLQVHFWMSETSSYNALSIFSVCFWWVYFQQCIFVPFIFCIKNKCKKLIFTEKKVW